MSPFAIQAPSFLRTTAVVCLVTLTLNACGGGSTPPIGPAVVPEPVVGKLAPVDVSAVALADPGSALPGGWQNGAFMQIFVRSYQDSDGDGIGDLRGLIQRLDYLKNLGVRGLWLMPVTQSWAGFPPAPAGKRKRMVARGPAGNGSRSPSMPGP